MMACRTDEVQVHTFLTQQEMEVSGQLHVPTALTQVKETAVPITKIAQWVPEPVWVLLGREKTYCPCWESKNDSSVSPVTILTI